MEGNERTLLSARCSNRALTPLELAVGDERLVGLLTDFCSTQEDVRTSAFDM